MILAQLIFVSADLHRKFPEQTLELRSSPVFQGHLLHSSFRPLSLPCPLYADSSHEPAKLYPKNQSIQPARVGCPQRIVIMETGGLRGSTSPDRSSDPVRLKLHRTPCHKRISHHSSGLSLIFCGGTTSSRNMERSFCLSRCCGDWTVSCSRRRLMC